MALVHIYTANGSEDDFNIVFSYLEKEDVSVAVEPSGGSYDVKTLDTHYTISGDVVTFKSDHIPPNNSKVRVRRSTQTSQPRHTYYAGSSVTADSLNTNYKQILYALDEFKENNAATLVVDVANGSITLGKMADNSVGTDQYVDSSIKTAHIDNDQVTADKLANSINTEIAANTAKVTNATHTGEVTGATALTIADDVVDEANLKISNAGSNGEFLSKQSGNTGGLTWAAVAGPSAGSVIKTEIAYGPSGSGNTAHDEGSFTSDSTIVSVTISPTAATNKMLVQWHGGFQWGDESTARLEGRIIRVIGSSHTVIWTTDHLAYRPSTHGGQMKGIHNGIMRMDDGYDTTDDVTYWFQAMKSSGVTGTFYSDQNNHTLLVQEIQV